MSVADREYWRDDRGPGRGLASAPAKWILIGATTAAFLAQSAVENAGLEPFLFVQRNFPLSVDGLASFRLWQPLTYALLHADFIHLLWNMVGLFFFASVLERRVPRREILGLYLAGALAGAAAQVAWVLAGLAPPEARVVGASGAVTALLVCAALRAPGTPFLLFLVLPVPLWLLGAFYVGRDALAAVTGTAGSVAVQAHLGGALAGALAAWRPWAYWRRLRPRPPERRGAGSPGTARAAPAPDPAEAAVEARVDALLQRIHERGIASLTDEEREFLRKASERYRGRRRP